MTKTIDRWKRGVPDGVWRETDAEVVLADNGLVAIPDAIVQFTRLRTLDLAHNRLAALPPLPPVSDFLYLHDNALATLPALPAVRYLNVGDNPLGALPDALPPTLQELHADRCGLHTLPAGIASLAELRELHLRDNRLATVESLAALDRLVILDLRGNPLAALPEAAWPELDKLDLRWTPLGDSMVADRLAARGVRVLR